MTQYNSGYTSGGVTEEQPVLLSDRCRPYGLFRPVIVDLQAAIGTVAREFIPVA